MFALGKQQQKKQFFTRVLQQNWILIKHFVDSLTVSLYFFFSLKGHR
jgi:hypothetical protein